MLLLLMVSAPAMAQFTFQDVATSTNITGPVLGCEGTGSASIRVVTASNYSDISSFVQPSLGTIGFNATDSSIWTFSWTNIFVDTSVMWYFTDASTATADSIEIEIYPFNLSGLFFNDTLFNACDTQSVGLNGGSPMGGTYTIPGFPAAISGGQLHPDELPPGEHQLVYTVTTPNGCVLTEQKTIYIRGLVASGSGINVGGYNAGTTLLTASDYLGYPTYNICDGSPTQIFALRFLNSLSDYDRYRIDWGNGNISTGVLATNTNIQDTFYASSLYTIEVTLYDDDIGCNLVDTLQFYFGSTQALGLSTPGNTAACFAPGQDSLFFDFELNSWQLDPDGIYYTFEGNDDSTRSKSATSPLVTAGVSNYPFLIYDNVTNTLYYRHVYYRNSCGASTQLGATSYDNVFAVTAFKSSPCPGSQSTAAVGPIIISETPRAEVVSPPSTCVNVPITIEDSTYDGAYIQAQGTNFICDESVEGVWTVFDSNGVILNPGAVFNTSGGTALGDTGLSAAEPSTWNYGTTNLELVFFRSGYYRVQKRVGLVNAQATAICNAVDTGSTWFCVDSIVPVIVNRRFPDTICQGDPLEAVFQRQTSFCGVESMFKVTINDASNAFVDSTVMSTDTVHSMVSPAIGLYTVIYESESACGNTTITDTLIVLEPPVVNFLNDTTIVCGDTAIFTLGLADGELADTLDFRPFDSTFVSITPDTAITNQGPNSSGYDTYRFGVPGSYLITVYAFNRCGSDTTEHRLIIDPYEDPGFATTEYNVCGEGALIIDSVYSAVTFDHLWTWRDTNNNTISTYTNQVPPTDTIQNNNPMQPNWYYLTHEVRSLYQCLTTQEDSIRIVPNPVAAFQSVSDICSPDTITVINNSVGYGLQYNWTLNQLSGPPSAGSIDDSTQRDALIYLTPLQFPDADATFELIMQVWNGDSCTQTAVDTFTLHALPEAFFTLPDSICGGTVVALDDSSDGNSAVNTWNWSVSPNTYTIAAPNAQNTQLITPINFGTVNETYTMELTISDVFGCQSDTIITGEILPTPLVDIALDSVDCPGVDFSTMVTLNMDTTSGDFTYIWRIYDPFTATTVQTDTVNMIDWSLVNNTNGIRELALDLNVTNLEGCSHDTTIAFYIYPNGFAQLVPDTVTDCAPFTVDPTVITATASIFNGGSNWYYYDLAGTLITQNTALNYLLPMSSDSVVIVYEAISSVGCATMQDTALAYTSRLFDPYFNVVQDSGCSLFQVDLDSIASTSGTHRWIIRDTTGTQVGATYTGTAPVFGSFPQLLNNGQSRYNIEHTIYTVGLGSCDTSFSTDFYVHPRPVIDIAALPTVCGGDTAALSGIIVNGTAVLDWNWTIATDTFTGQNINVSYTAPNVYPIELQGVTGFGCDATTQDTIIFHSFPEASYTTSSSCDNDTVCENTNFTLTGVPNLDSLGGTNPTYSWDLDDDGIIDGTSNTITLNLTPIGWRSVRLYIESEFGCGDDTLFQLYVNDPPQVAVAITEDSICGPGTPMVTHTESGQIDTCFFELFSYDGSGTKVSIQSWDLVAFTGLPVLQPSYIRDSLYVLEKSVINCCGLRTSSDSVYIKTPPVADFQFLPDTGCAPYNSIMQLDGLVTGQADSVYIDFGDGTDTIVTTTPILVGSTYRYIWTQVPHTFYYNGAFDTTYFVTLTAYNQCGDSSMTRPVNVQAGTVQAAFTASTYAGCDPVTVNFSTFSFSAVGVSWCFDYDQATEVCSSTTTVVQNPTYTYTTPGTYTVAHFVQSTCSADTAYATIVVDPAPVASFTMSATNTCGNDTIYFNNTSTVSTGTLIGHTWSFGDGDSSFLENPYHIYDTAGIYNVVLTVTESNGCTNTDSMSITIQPTPLMDFTLSPVCVGDTMFFNNLSSVPSGTFAGVSWDFGDGNTSNQTNPGHIFATPGLYKVTLTGTSNLGCTDSISYNALVNPRPDAGFTFAMTGGDSCSLPQTYTFTNTSTGAIQYNWDFDKLGNPGGNTSNLTSPTHSFTSAGIYTIELYTENAFGCWDTITESIVVVEGVQGAFTTNAVNGCAPLNVTFQDVSIVDPNNSLATVQWYFGDGSSFISTTPPFSTSHSYSIPGTYSVYSVVTDAIGCESITGLQTINVYEVPQPDFDFTSVGNQIIEMENLTTPLDSIALYSWQFEDGQSSNDIAPTVAFQPYTSGYDSLRICLTVTSVFGCVDDTCRNSWVWTPGLYVPNAFAPGLDYAGVDQFFLPIGHSLESYEMWIYDKWGNQIFYTDEIAQTYFNPATGWDGTFDGEPLPMGVYSWRIRAAFRDGTRWMGQENEYGIVKPYGTLTLIR